MSGQDIIQQSKTAQIDTQKTVTAILDQYLLGFYQLYPKNVILQEVDIQRKLDRAHVEELCRSFIKGGMHQRHQHPIHVVAYTSPLNASEGVLRTGTFGVLIGQHRLHALKEALEKEGIDESDAWWGVYVYKKGISETL